MLDKYLTRYFVYPNLQLGVLDIYLQKNFLKIISCHMIVGLLGSMSGDIFMITGCVSYESGPVGHYVRWYIMKDAGCMSYDSGPVGIYVMCTVIIYRIFEMIGWRSKIGWSDWLKLIREFIFTRTLEDSNLDSSNWFYALLGLFESPYRGLYVY